MTGQTRRMQAVRRYLARLVAVVAVLAGLTLASGAQCTEGMATAMPAAQGMNMVGADSHAADDITPMAPDHGMGGGLLATCLAFIIVIAAVSVAFGPAGLRIVSRVLRSTGVAAVRFVRSRALSLAELCLLRT